MTAPRTAAMTPTMTPAGPIAVFGSVATVDVHVRGVACTGDFSVSLTSSDVTMAEVFAALQLPADSSADGQRVASPAQTLAANVLRRGMTLCAAPENAADPSLVGGHDREPSAEMVESGAAGAASIEIAVVAGLDAGQITTCDPGVHRLEDRGLGSRWCVQVRDVAPKDTQGRPWHDLATVIEVVSERDMAVAFTPIADPEPGYSSTVHRPPRVEAWAEVAPIELTAPPRVVPEPAPLSWAALLAPIPIALMMAFFFRPIFALFAAMGPIMAVGRWYESRRRFRRSTRERRTVVQEQRAAVERSVADQQEAVAQLRWVRNPHVAELCRRARTRSVRLWERRPESSGFLVVTAGVGPDEVPVQTNGDSLDDETHAALHDRLRIRAVPHTIDLYDNSGVGIHGPRADALAVARSILLQVVTMHGPADVTVGVLCSHSHATDWDWVKWLPHADSSLMGHGAKAVAYGLAANRQPTDRRPAAKASRRSESSTGPIRLVVVDDVSADVAALTRAAAVAGQELRVIAVADQATSLPAVCSSLIALDPVALGKGAAEIATPQLVGRRRQVQPVGISADTATTWARLLAPLVDPEVVDLAAGTLQTVSLLRLVGFRSAYDLAQDWSARSPDAPIAAAIGVGADGPFQLNLTEDGPHALIAGTTGSGKSELLRTMVLALAATCPPDQLNFVLIDFKGGGAFDAVDKLPHVAGLITDLDETLVARALSSLRAELVRRETLFRSLGVSSYRDAVKRCSEPLARLVIVIDEFAALATDYGELMAAIIDLAARGRSLGMHLTLATQRPSGVVDQKIRANTNLRVALRVQDTFDSQDVIGVPDAAHLDRKTPGRAIFTVGGDRPVHVQTAYSGAPDTRADRCDIRRHELFAVPSSTTSSTKGAATELEVLVDAIRSASLTQWQPARPLWAAPLPQSLDWIDLGARQLSPQSSGSDLADTADDTAAEAGVALGLADLPDRQTQHAWRWDPATGPLVIYGGSAECAGKVLVSIGAALASTAHPENLHLYVVDGGAGLASQLGQLPHTGACVPQMETDRVDRTLRYFETSLQQRRLDRSVPVVPHLVLFIDNLASVLGNYHDVDAAKVLDRLGALARDGASQRIHVVIAARAVRDMPHRLTQLIANRLVLSLADPDGYLALGFKAKEVPPLPPMRALDVGSKTVVQLVEPPDFSNWSDPPPVDGGRATQIGTFPAQVGRSELGPATCSGDALCIPVGIESEELDEARLVLHGGEHALIIAPNGLGRSTLLQMVAEQLGVSDVEVDLMRITPRRSPLAGSDVPGTLIEDPTQVAGLANATGRTVILVDDANSVEPAMAAALEQLVTNVKNNVHVIAATNPDAARSMLAWTSKLRSAGVGAVIGGTAADGELFKVRFGRLDELGSRLGRGHLVVRGRVQQVQFARPNAAN